MSRTDQIRCNWNLGDRYLKTKRILGSFSLKNRQNLRFHVENFIFLNKKTRFNYSFHIKNDARQQ